MKESVIVSSRQTRIDKTNKVKTKRKKLAKLLISSQLNSSVLSDSISKSYHNVRGVVRDLREKALSVLVKKNKVKDCKAHFNHDSHSLLELRKRAIRHHEKIALEKEVLQEAV